MTKSAKAKSRDDSYRDRLPKKRCGTCDWSCQRGDGSLSCRIQSSHGFWPNKEPSGICDEYKEKT